MPTPKLHFVLPYRAAEEDRDQLDNEFWGRVAEVIVPLAYWAVVAGAATAFLGAVVLWGVLIAQAA